MVTFCLLYTNRRTEECGNFLREAFREISQTSHLPFLLTFPILAEKKLCSVLSRFGKFQVIHVPTSRRRSKMMWTYSPLPPVISKSQDRQEGMVFILWVLYPLTSTSLSPCCFPQTYRQVRNFQIPSQALLAAIMARHEADKSNPARGQLHEQSVANLEGDKTLLMEEVLHLLIDNWGGGFKYFYFHPYLGKIPILTNIFQMGWNHQLDH